MAFSFAAPKPTVLIVGSGTGNDVAAALRHDSPSIDAVEIDPFILEIGRTEHPERPYDSSRVSVHLTDARAFLKRTPLQLRSGPVWSAGLAYSTFGLREYADR